MKKFVIVVFDLKDGKSYTKAGMYYFESEAEYPVPPTEAELKVIVSPDFELDLTKQKVVTCDEDNLIDMVWREIQPRGSIRDYRNG